MSIVQMGISKTMLWLPITSSIKEEIIICSISVLQMHVSKNKCFVFQSRRMYNHFAMYITILEYLEKGIIQFSLFSHLIKGWSKYIIQALRYYCVLTLSMYGYPKKVSCILGKKVLDYSFQEALKGIQEEGGPKAFFFMSFFSLV